VATGRRSLAAYRRALNPGGRIVVAGGAVGQIVQAMLLGPALSLVHAISVRNLLARPGRHELAFVSQLLDAGAVVPVIDRCYPLCELPEAMHYFAAGHASGEVFITMEQNGA
jgi:NADPH:quinone reductase-like Zn-dependent oxidoreductase